MTEYLLTELGKHLSIRLFMKISLETIQLSLSKSESKFLNISLISHVTRIKFPQCADITLVPKSVKAIAILFFAISKLGEIDRHLKQTHQA